jgi:hypothetical protein
VIYRIIIAKDNKKKKILHEGRNIHNAKSKFFSTVDKNVVLFPKKHNAYKKNKPVKYEILLLKEFEDGDTPFYDRDELGKTREVEVKDQSWTILEKRPYDYEERFSVFGIDRRLEMKEIIKFILMVDIKKEKVIKQINYINNNVLIHHNGDFDIVRCKCVEDAKRFHNTMRDFCEKMKIKNVIFSGVVRKSNKTEIYKKIKKKTGWKKNRIYSSTTRP